MILLVIGLCSCKQKQDDKTNIALNLKQYTIEQFMDNEAVGGGSFSPDKSKLLVSSNRTGIYNMYTVPVKGGKFQALSASDSASIFAISFFPKDERILYRCR